MTTIDTRLGRIEGRRQRDVLVFLGIPYAAPPTGQRRWLPPAAAAPPTGTLDATTHAARSLQPPYPEALAGVIAPGEESEDCLYLNVYTPAADGKRRPVLFWIHGGAYIQGAANEYDGTTLAEDNDVVVVAINYRLGIFGFFDLSRFGPEYEGSASLGFQDQIAALRWVRDHIEDFGGDPGNVTIWGESAGAGSVLALLAAPSAEGLFHRAVAFSPGSPGGEPTDNVTPLANHLGVAPDQALARLRELPARELFELQEQGLFNTTACIDGTVITRSPVEAIRERGDAGVPLIAGCCKDEGTFLGPVVEATGAGEFLVPVFASLIAPGDPGRYLKFLEGLLPGASVSERIVRVWYDLFRAASLQAAQAATLAGAGGWVYNFDVPTDNPLGTTHASDIAFTFNAFKHAQPTISFHDGSDPKNRDLAACWSATFTAFARTGAPNGAGLPEWPEYAPDTRACLLVDHSPRVAHDPDGEELLRAYGLA